MKILRELSALLIDGLIALAAVAIVAITVVAVL